MSPKLHAGQRVLDLEPVAACVVWKVKMPKNVMMKLMKHGCRLKMIAMATNGIFSELHHVYYGVECEMLKHTVELTRAAHLVDEDISFCTKRVIRGCYFR